MDTTSLAEVEEELREVERALARMEERKEGLQERREAILKVKLGAFLNKDVSSTMYCLVTTLNCRLACPQVTTLLWLSST